MQKSEQGKKENPAKPSGHIKYNKRGVEMWTPVEQPHLINHLKKSI